MACSSVSPLPTLCVDPGSGVHFVAVSSKNAIQCGAIITLMTINAKRNFAYTPTQAKPTPNKVGRVINYKLGRKAEPEARRRDEQDEGWERSGGQPGAVVVFAQQRQDRHGPCIIKAPFPYPLGFSK